MPETIVREVPLDAPEKLVHKDAKKARLQRFARYCNKEGTNRVEALEKAGDLDGSPLSFYTKKMKIYLADRLYSQAVLRGLLIPTRHQFEIEEVIPKEELLTLLTQQARGERPTFRSEVLRKNPDTNAMEVVEVRSTFDEQKAQDLLAKVHGLYDEKPQGPTLNIAVVVDSLKGEERAKAENLLMEAHLKMLEAGGPSAQGEVIDVETEKVDADPE
jgi:hypothetical protein